MSEPLESPILKAYGDLLEAERACAEMVRAAEDEARDTADQQRQAHNLEISISEKQMKEANSLRYNADREFILRRMATPTFSVTPSLSGDGDDVRVRRRAALDRVKASFRELDFLWNTYDYEVKVRRQRLKLMLFVVTGGAIGLTILLLAWLDELARNQQLANIERTAIARETDAAMQVTGTAQALQATGTAIPDLLTRMRAYGTSYIKHNADWTPVVQNFDGVAMVLVPPGCFMMGSVDGSNIEQPVHEQCFVEPFWIDLTEVTQADFERLGGVKAQENYFDGDRRPVEQITWFEARDFCALRGARLPTEAEWEYAARGPDGWTYPWGDTLGETYADLNRAVWNRDDHLGTEIVGSRPSGASWVGALDMSGNVWEWTSSLYRDYPYDAADGREADTGAQTSVYRVVRGGSWNFSNSYILRATYRNYNRPDFAPFFYGFRCVRSS